MQLPAIKEKISRLPRLHKILLVISVFVILIILSEVFYFFYYGFHRQSIHGQGIKVQGWLKGRRLDVISGTVVKKEGSILTIENEGEEMELNVVSKALYCGESASEKTTTQCRIIEGTQISEGQFLIGEKSPPWADDFNFNSLLEGEMFITIWDSR